MLGQFDVAQKAVFWMVASVVIATIILVFAFMLVGFKTGLSGLPTKLDAEITGLRFVNTCFSEKAGVIIFSEFTQENLDKCYKTEDAFSALNFKLILEGSGTILKTDNYVETEEFIQKREVLVQRETTITKDVMTVHVQKKI